MCIPELTIVGRVSVHIYHGLQVGRKLVEFVDGSNINPARVLVHHQIVELWPVIIRDALDIFKLVNNVPLVGD